MIYVNVRKEISENTEYVMKPKTNSISEMTLEPLLRPALED